MSIVLLTSIICTTIVYSAFNTELQIEGEAVLRTAQEIRVSSLELIDSSGSVLEFYNRKYAKDTTSMYVTLDGNSSMTYDVTISNKSLLEYDVSKIEFLTNDNSNLDTSISLREGDLISPNSDKKFTFKITNKGSDSQSGTIVTKYSFAKRINSYVVGEYNEPKAYTVTIPRDGEYMVELWGASGSLFTDMADDTYGRGGYTRGTINLSEGDILYVYVGETSTNYKKNEESFNGGGRGGASGGGATDIRLIGGAWNNFDSLKSRIMVAGGGGGGSYKYSNGYYGYYQRGDAGGLYGFDASFNPGGAGYGYSGYGGTQTGGGNPGKMSSVVSEDKINMHGQFGFGGYGFNNGQNTPDSSGGGGGYYGGGYGVHPGFTWSGGGGGSSYISGYSGCDAIASSSTENNIIHTGQPKHYSGKVFSDSIMINGASSMPTHDGKSTMVGNTGNGYAKITYLYSNYENIRVSNLNIVDISNSASEIVPNIYTNETTSLYVTLPANSSITYEVEFSNRSSNDYNLSAIENLTYDNSNIKISYGIAVGEQISKKSNKKFTIKLTNNTSSVQNGTIITKYLFDKTVTSHIVAEYNVPKSYELKVPYTGEYEIELWGASGNGDGYKDTQGRGGYTKGTIKLSAGETLYFYVGQVGNHYSDRDAITFNGGGSGGAGGGGATDVRLVGGDWKNFNSLKSRIMVAGAGGGGVHSNGFEGEYQRGDAGGLNGFDARFNPKNASGSGGLYGYGYSGYGGTQTSGGKPGKLGDRVPKELPSMHGHFGYGGYGSLDGAEVTEASGGGSGYYGGGHGIHPGSNWSGGGGGSSFISGYTGCNAIAVNSTESNIIHTGQANHYSGNVFTKSVMIDGASMMPTFDGNGSMIGNTGNGHAKITFIK